MPNIDDLINTATPAEATLALCLDGALASRIEDLERQVKEAKARSRDSLADSGDADLHAELEQLKERRRDATVLFRFRALNRWQVKQIQATLPTDSESRKAGRDQDQMTRELITRCCFEPVLTAEQWDRLVGPAERLGDGALTPAQFAAVDQLVVRLNFIGADPFS